MGRQKSADAVVAGPNGEGLNVQCWKEFGSSMTMTDADGGTEMSRASSEVGGRKPLEQEVGASSVTAEPMPRPEAEAGLLEMILSRENMMAASTVKYS